MYYISRLLLLLLLLSTTTASAAADLSSDHRSLLAFRAAVLGRTLLWNATASSPCSYQGVQCFNNRVTSLRLPASSLSGPIPPLSLSNLSSLRTLSLRLNHLSGPFPSDLSLLPLLRNLYLQGNHFQGNLPSALFAIHSLVRLNLASNNFSGTLSAAVNNLTRLRTLYLNDNRLSGGLPEVKLVNLVQFNVSFNSLNGSIPKSLEGMPGSAFSGNLLCGKPLGLACGKDGRIVPPAIAGISLPNDGEESEGKKKDGLSGGAISGIVIGCVVGLVFVVCILCVLCRKKGGSKSGAVDVRAIKGQENDNSAENPMVEAAESGGGGVGSGSNGFSDGAAAAAAGSATNRNGDIGGEVGKKLLFFGKSPKVFDLEDLLRASAEVLGKGTFGTSYKAVLEMGGEVAVKRLKDVVISEIEFREKIEGVGAMDHENLVPLRAYYYSREEKLLVYDYMPMGSLSALLHGQLTLKFLILYATMFAMFL